MSKTFTINGTDYTFPESGQEPSWAEQVTDWAEAVTESISGISSTGDILTTTFQPADNQSSASNITGFSFDGTTLQGFIAEYSIYRTDGANEYSETGHLYGAYNTLAGTWKIEQVGVGVETTGITLSITNTGQIQYTSTSLGGTHSCKMSFRAHSFANS